MPPAPADRFRYEGLRRGRRTLKLVAALVQGSLLLFGLTMFLEQAGSLMSDAQFTWGERRVMGLTALVSLGGCGLACWAAGRLLGVFGELFDALADGAEASWRTVQLLETQIVPALNRVAAALEDETRRGDPPLKEKRR